MAVLKKIIIFSIVFGFAGILILWLFIVFSKASVREKYRSLNKLQYSYAYDSTKAGKLQPVYYVQSIDKIDNLIEFYENKKNNRNPYLTFSPCFLPFSHKIFIIDSLKESKVYRIIDFDTLCWGKIEGFTLSEFLHKTPASKIMATKYNEFIDSINKADHTGNPYRIKKPFYGIQCQE